MYQTFLAVYIGEDTPDEPDFQYIPDTHHIASTLPPGGDQLEGSILLLTEGLESGAALAQFEVSADYDSISVKIDSGPFMLQTLITMDLVTK